MNKGLSSISFPSSKKLLKIFFVNPLLLRYLYFLYNSQVSKSVNNFFNRIDLTFEETLTMDLLPQQEINTSKNLDGLLFIKSFSKMLLKTDTLML